MSLSSNEIPPPVSTRFSDALRLVSIAQSTRGDLEPPSALPGRPPSADWVCRVVRVLETVPAVEAAHLLLMRSDMGGPQLTIGVTFRRELGHLAIRIQLQRLSRRMPMVNGTPVRVVPLNDAGRSRVKIGPAIYQRH